MTEGKTRQRSDAEDRTLEYRRWRWRFGNGCYVTDIDQVEWRGTGSRAQPPRPVALIELSRVDSDGPLGAGYLAAVLARFIERDAQYDVLRLVAAALHVHAYLTLFRHDLSEFWVYSFAASRWRHMDRDTYARWLRAL